MMPERRRLGDAAELDRQIVDADRRRPVDEFELVHVVDLDQPAGRQELRRRLAITDILVIGRIQVGAGAGQHAEPGLFQSVVGLELEIGPMGAAGAGAALIGVGVAAGRVGAGAVREDLEIELDAVDVEPGERHHDTVDRVVVHDEGVFGVRAVDAPVGVRERTRGHGAIRQILRTDDVALTRIAVGCLRAGHGDRAVAVGGEHGVHVGLDLRVGGVVAQRVDVANLVEGEGEAGRPGGVGRRQQTTAPATPTAF